MAGHSRRNSRALILSAAREEFGQRGYAGGRVDRISRRAGVNKQLIFYYFGSKAGLFDEVVKSASVGLSQVVGAADQSVGPLEQLRSVLESAFRALGANRDLLRAAFMAAETANGSGAFIGEELARLDEQIRSLVSEAQGLGYVRDDVDPAAVAHLAVATVVGSVMLGVPPGNERLRVEIDLVIRSLAW